MDDHGWTHSICLECWNQLNPDREPVRALGMDVEECCWCGAVTVDGIYVRQDPKVVHRG